MTTDTIASFIAAMESAGVVPAESIADRLGSGGPIYFDCVGDKPRSRKGWAVLHMDERPAGAFGHFRLCINERWRGGKLRGLSPDERTRLKAEAEAARAKRAAELLAIQDATASDCEHLWSIAGLVDPAHAYLARKRIAGEGLKQAANGKLYVPMRDRAGKLWNVQMIHPDGTKRFAKGGRQSGLSLMLGEPSGSILIGEGYATMATVRRATGLAVVVAFSAANLKAAAVDTRQRFPDAEIIICADDDAHLVTNPLIARNIGAEAAHDAALAVGGHVAMPPRKVTT